jgi:hypothetical protein
VVRFLLVLTTTAVTSPVFGCLPLCPQRVEDAGKVEDKKERTSKSKPRSTDEEREMRKERKLGRKRVGDH